MRVRKAMIADLTLVQDICTSSWYDTYQTIHPKAYIDQVVEEYYVWNG